MLLGEFAYDMAVLGGRKGLVPCMGSVLKPGVAAPVRFFSVIKFYSIFCQL
jgi:hypothetical protein